MKKASGFEKFINPKSNAKKKEEFRVQKRKAKADMRAYGEELRREKDAKNRGDYTPFERKSYTKKPFEKRTDKQGNERRGAKFAQKDVKKKENNRYKSSSIGATKERYSYTEKRAETSLMPLNKYIAHSGICGRREAAELVKKGVVVVNGDIVYEPGIKVSEKDVVKVKDKVIALQENMVYILMNKPKDHITTLEDDKGRKTVNDLVKNYVQERVYPIGRLDRNTTGVLLMTNDGDLAQKLSHPSFEVKKIYEATLDKPLEKADATKILAGFELEDGFIKADALGYVDAKDKRVVGIEIHSGKNHIIKRLFYHLGYSVTKLDRVMFANLTKKNVERGKWRFLNEKEVRALKMMKIPGLEKKK